MTSDTGKWINNDAIIDITDEGTQITRNTDGQAKYLLDTTVNYPATIEFTYMGGGSICGLGFDGGDLDNTGSIWFINYFISSSKLSINSYPSSTSTSRTGASTTKTLNVNDVIKVIVEEENIGLYLNNILLISKKSYKLDLSDIFEFYSYNNSIQKIKGFKIKLYSV